MHQRSFEFAKPPPMTAAQVQERELITGLAPIIHADWETRKAELIDRINLVLFEECGCAITFGAEGWPDATGAEAQQIVEHYRFFGWRVWLRESKTHALCIELHIVELIPGINRQR